MTRKTQTAGEMKKSKSQTKRRSTSRGSPTPSDSPDAVLTRRQAAQLTPQTRSKNKVNKIIKKSDLQKRKDKVRKNQERKKKKVLLSLKKEKSKIFQRNKLNDSSTSSSKSINASPPQNIEWNSDKPNRSLEKVNAVGTSVTGLVLAASKSKSLLDRSKIMLEKELREARRQVKKPIRNIDGREECYHKGLNSFENTKEKLAPKGLIENEGRCPGFDRFGRPITDIPDIVIVKEEMEDIDEDDIMDIVLCPSPVWWEEPVDEELKTLFQKEEEKCAAPEVQNTTRSSANADSNKKKTFTLEKILENIRLKNINSEKEKGIIGENSTDGAAVILNRDISENDSGPVSIAIVKVSEKTVSENNNTKKVEIEATSALKATMGDTNCLSEVNELNKSPLEDVTDEEVTRFTQVSATTAKEKSPLNDSGEHATIYIESVVDLTLEDDENNAEIVACSLDTMENENQNINLELSMSPSDTESHISKSTFEKQIEQNVNNIESCSDVSANNRKQVEDMPKCANNSGGNDLARVQPTDFEKDKSKQVSNNFDTKDRFTNTNNDGQKRTTQTISDEGGVEERSVSVTQSVKYFENIETESVPKEQIFRSYSIINVPTIEIDVREVILGKEYTEAFLSIGGKDGEEKSMRKEGNEVRNVFSEKRIDGISNEKDITANTVAKKNPVEMDCDLPTRIQENMTEMESGNLAKISIENGQLSKKRNTNVTDKNVENDGVRIAQNKNITLNTETNTALYNTNDSKNSKVVKAAHRTKVPVTQKNTIQNKKLVKIVKICENSEISHKLQDLPSNFTNIKEKDISTETEKCTEKETSVSSAINNERCQDEAERIKEEMKVIEDGLRMAQEIQKLSESHIDSSKKSKLLELSSELFKTLKSSMQELKGADEISEIPFVSEIEKSNEFENDNPKEGNTEKYPQQSAEKICYVNIELQNIKNQNLHKQSTEDVAICTMVSENSKKQVKKADFIARSQKIRNTYLGIVDYESNYKKDKINENKKYESISNSENDERKRSTSVNASTSYNSISELSNNEISNLETHLIATGSRKQIVKNLSSADELKTFPLNCESTNKSTEISKNNPICGATPVSTSPRADFQENDLPSDTSKICVTNNPSNFCCSNSVSDIPQESAKKLSSISKINFSEILNSYAIVRLKCLDMRPEKYLKVKEIQKVKDDSDNSKRKKIYTPKPLSKVNKLSKSSVGKFKNTRISKKRNVRMKSTRILNKDSAKLQKNVDKCDVGFLESSANLGDNPYESNKVKNNSYPDIEPKTEIENSENEGSYEDILKSLQSLINENDGATVIEHSENRTSGEATATKKSLPKLRKEVCQPKNSEYNLNLNGSEIALADLKAIANDPSRNIKKLPPQKYVEMDKLVILETPFKPTEPKVTDDNESDKNEKQMYIEMDSLHVMDDKKDILTPKLEDLIPGNENPLEISSETLEKIRDILGIPEFDRSNVNLRSLEDISSKKPGIEAIDDSLNGKNEVKKNVQRRSTMSLECTETFDPKMDLCDTLGVPYVEYSPGKYNVNQKSLLNLKEVQTKVLPPIETVVNNIGKENLDSAKNTRDIRTKRKRIDYKQLAKGIRNDHSEVTLKRIKTVNNKETSDIESNTKSLTQDMIANIIGVNVTASNDDKLENVYLDVDQNLCKNICKHRKQQSDGQCQKCTLRFTYNSCIKLLEGSQSDSDSKLAEEASKIVACSKLYKCGQCEYVCGRRDNLRTHFRKHTDERPYNCSVCGHKARTKDHLMRHRRTHDNLPKDDWRKSHREARKMISESKAKLVPEEVFRDHSYARH